MVNYVEIGFNNLKRILAGENPAEVLAPTPDKIKEQVMAAGSSGGAQPIIEIGGGGAKQLLDAANLDFSKWGKYAKYALLGGAGLLAYSVLKK